MVKRSDDDELKDALERALPGARIDFDRSEWPSLYVIVTAEQFAGMSEVERQSLVWGVALETLGDYGASQLSFIFTDSPQERTPAAS